MPKRIALEAKSDSSIVIVRSEPLIENTVLMLVTKLTPEESSTTQLVVKQDEAPAGKEGRAMV